VRSARLRFLDSCVAATVFFMPKFFSSGNRTLLLPGSRDRALVRPDVRHLVVPRLTGSPILDEVDYDDLVIHSQYRVYEENRPSEVRYMMYELSQKSPDQVAFDYFFKAVRVVKVTRVPRYLRQSSASGPSIVIDQQRDLLAGLREKGAVFMNVIAKCPSTAMLFTYGVSGVGPTPEAAQREADVAFAALVAQLDGLYQQLEYKPLTLAEGEALVRYQSQWDRIAMARGRPVPNGVNLGASSALDGNRTDVENTLNQLEAFLRGMAERDFILSLVCVPIEAEHMTTAWRNVTGHLSKIRSEQSGSRSFSAGVALPLSFGSSLGKTTGNTHSTGESVGTSASDGVSRSVADGVSSGQSVGQTATHGVSSGASITDSQGHSVSAGRSVSDSVSSTLGQSASASHSVTDSVSQGLSLSHGQSQSLTHGQSLSDSFGQSSSASLAQGQSVGESSSSSFGQSAGQSWGSSLGQNVSSGVNQSSGWNTGSSNSLSNGIALNGSHGTNVSNGQSSATGSGVGGGLPGIMSGNNNTTQTGSASSGTSVGTGLGLNYSGTAGTSQGVTGSLGSSLNQGVSWGENVGGNVGQSASLTNGVSVGQSMTATQGVGTSFTQSAGQSLGLSNGVSQTLGQSLSTGQSSGLSTGQSVSESVGRGQTLSASTGESLSASRSMSTSQGESFSQAQSLSASQGVSRTETAGVSQGVAANRGLSDAYSVAASRAVSQTSSLGAVPSVGVSVSRNVFDERKRMIGDVLEMQAARYLQGLEGGGFFYQLFLLCPDSDTLAAATALLKSAFWGPSAVASSVPQPFHTISDFEPDEAARLHEHAKAFTHYRKREVNSELVEPHLFSTFTTCFEVAAMSHPPTAEAFGLLAVHDSMPVMAMPSDRQDRDLKLGYVVNGERGKVSNVAFGVDVDELTHTLIAGSTGSGKTSTLLTLLSELTTVERTVVTREDPTSPQVEVKQVKAGIVGLDWMSNMRDLASVVEPDRFRFYSIARPELGAFRWNPLAVPDPRMNPMEWANDIADQMTIAFNLAEFGRSLVAEFIGELYTANRLEPYALCSELTDALNNVIRPAIWLEPIDRATLPPNSTMRTQDGVEVANVISCPELSRLLSMEHLATIVAAKVEEAATPEGARLMGQSMRDRLQSLWRRVSYFAPGSPYAGILACDETLDERTTVAVPDLIDPDKGIVAIIEADGLDQTNRKFILGAVLLAIWRYGQFQGVGALNHDGQGPGTWVVLEEAHELFGPQGEEEDNFTAATRSSLYESLFRRSRALGMKLVAVVQNAGSVPTAVTSNVSTVFVHRQYDEADRKRVFNLLNWNNQVGQQQREWRYLGEMAMGFCIARLDAKESWLESAPIHFRTELAALSKVSDTYLRSLAERRRSQHRP
jgi:hypothetical protein